MEDNSTPDGPCRAVDVPSAVAPPTRPTAADHAALAAGLPNPRLWAAHLAACAVQVMLGRRAVPQLNGWATTAAIEELIDNTPTQIGPGRIRSVRCLAISPAIIEAVVVLDCGPRTRALAMRLEVVNLPLRPRLRRYRPGPRWVATSLRLL